MYLSDIHLSVGSSMFSLLLRCPFSVPMANCPFEHLRQEPSLEKKFLLADFLAADPSRYQALLTHHTACQSGRYERRSLSTRWANEQVGDENHPARCRQGMVRR